MIKEDIQEIWKDIKGYEGLYQVSNLGRTKSFPRLSWNGKKYIKREEMISKIYNRNKYTQVSLRKDGNIKQISVHRLVALYFIPNPDDKPMVDHIDGNKSNNRVDNLRWVTNQENVKNETTLKKHKIPVIAYKRETKEKIYFESITEAMKQGFSYTFIKECLRSKNKSKRHKGYEWFYTNPNRTSLSKSRAEENPKIFTDVV